MLPRLRRRAATPTQQPHGGGGHTGGATVQAMPQTASARLTPTTLLLLLIPPLMWAGNAVVGRLMQGVVPPVTLNFLRWVLAMLMLLPLAGWVLRPGSGLWTHWRRFALLGLLGVGMYNSLQYMALKTSTPLNVTLVASSIPVCSTACPFRAARRWARSCRCAAWWW
jgi:hypothetical protein